jgi:hypothetical protein
VHQERRVDSHHPAVTIVDDMGVRVPAQPDVGLKQSDPVTAGQHVGGGEAGHATADHRD